ncbi:protein SOB FIVE-LIKE 5-like [Musa acuminata AAA Group]|uniref:protein SOB FIVE-LIKE 5-like n=1 Tax=Musa acuminata AAA Group TaxID=214697 RepID=UPI0031D5CF4C
MMLGEEEDVSSECSSGCQSGWTAYLDQSSYDSPQPLVYNKAGYLQEEEEEEEEEDLSMVSDASSGPPHFHEEDEPSFCYLHSSTCFEGGGCLCSALTPAAGSAKSGAKRKRVEPEQQREHSSPLDDTASSTLLSYPKTRFNGDSNSNNYLKPPMEGVLEFSCGFSATHFKRNHELHKQVGYLQSSSPVKPTPTRPVLRKEGGKKIW